ncbi:MAG: GIY-YIG nuclease family protein [Eubacteriales bacterium]|nr:GIY-YIG nuclease family protein [Eubacteriales bacterium]
MDLLGREAARQNELLRRQLYETQTTANNLFTQLEDSKRSNQVLQKKLKELGYLDYAKVTALVAEKNVEIAQDNEVIAKLHEKITELSAEDEKLVKQVKSSLNKLAKTRELYKSVEHAITNFFSGEADFRYCKLMEADSAELDELAPSVIIKLHAMDMKDLRKAFRDNDKQIEKLLKQYESRYTTKANRSIYQLMVIALRAELQNILYNLKYEKLDNAIQQVNSTTAKYLTIAADGNQSIAGTMTKFIGEMEYLFINAVKIEYNYYVKKEQARQEQLAIREQIRQEAEERKALEAERKKIEAEEQKYADEIENVRLKLISAGEEEVGKLNRRIEELQALLAGVIIKKEDIINLQNGKAGNIYIISNLGSFGENMFKIGMTRRLDPQDRVNELSDASVPFKFDVHSFIFSEDAVELEAKLHKELESKRVNKVNLRKEFFYSTVDELEEMVNSIEPTAEFNKTMLAEDFRQSLSSDEAYTSEFTLEDEEDSFV